jgi:hypothetical protein
MTFEFKRHEVESLARALLGAPNLALSRGHELRFGSHGSLAVHLDKATWHSHEDNVGGGMIDLVVRQTGMSGREALDWMQAQGVYPAKASVSSNAGEAPKHAPASNLTPAAAYDYQDETGALLFQVCRFESDARTPDGKRQKTFRQRRPDSASGGWSWKTQGVRQVPYRLPELIQHVAMGLTIFIAEGEKAVDTLRKLGGPATCNAGGAGKWPDALNGWFAGADVVILPDADEAGRRHADLVASRLRPFARRVRMLDLPGLPPKGDVADWQAAGGDDDQLYDLLEAVAYEAPPEIFVSRFGALPWERLDDPGPEQDYLIADFLTSGEKSIIGGPSRSGKSFLALHAGMAVARGTEFFGRVAEKGLVIYQAGEGARGVKKRLRAYRKHFGVSASERVPFVLLQSQIDLYRPDGDTLALIAEIKALAALYSEPLRLVVIDTLATAASGADENSGKDMGAVLANISKINAETGAHVCLVHHMNAGGKKLRGHTSLYANVDQVILVSRDEETRVRTVVLDKQKDDEDGLNFEFELLPVEVGLKPDGRALTSCVVLASDPQQESSQPPQPTSTGRDYLKARDELVFRALMSALAEHGQRAPPSLNLPGGMRVVSADCWRAAYSQISQHSGQSAARAIDGSGGWLARFNVIGRADSWVWWTGKPLSRAWPYEKGPPPDSARSWRNERTEPREPAHSLRGEDVLDVDVFELLQ